MFGGSAAARAACGHGVGGDGMRLNLGCGNRKRPGWRNVDKVPHCSPDEIVDLERLPWPWPDNSVDEMFLSHVLEHLGEVTDVYLGIIKEIYRVCRDGATITVVVPHPRHDNFLNDPTHVRAVTAEGLKMFSQASNRQLMAEGFGDTPLGIYLGVDLALHSVNFKLDKRWLRRLQCGEITEEYVRQAAATQINASPRRPS
jgi:hypothetical protein